MLSDEEIMAQVLAAFQEEETEHREAITDILLELEREPDHPKQKELVDQLFREAHSLKGGARAAGIEGVEQIAHRVEDLFSLVRQNRLQLTPDVCDSVYASVDAIGAMMSRLSAGQAASIEDYQPLMDALSGHITAASRPDEAPEPQGGTAANGTPPAAAKSSAPSDSGADDVEPATPVPAEPMNTVLPPDELTAAVPSPEDPHPSPAQPAESTPPAQPAESTPSEDVVQSPATPTAAPQRDGAQALPQTPRAELPPPAETPPDADPAPAAGNEAHPETVTTVRLAISTLDTLLNETGELITCSVRAQQRSREAHAIAEIPVRWRRIWRQVRPVISRLETYVPSLQPTVHHLNDRETNAKLVEQATRLLEQREDGHHHSTLPSQLATLLDALNQANTLITEIEHTMGQHARHTTEDYTRLSVVTDRLHDQIRRTRMLPITTLFSPLRLQVREIARASNKQIELTLEDGGAEADRQVLERLREVLMHLLRNSIDHGIEPADARTAQGKPAVGHVALRSSVNGDYLTIHIEDDGAGLDLEAIKQRAISAGLVGETDMSRISESELIDLIFLPGFSTRQVVSKMSGRGVGLDIVRSQVERMQGRVSVHSTPGAGSVFTISVPLSLTSSHGLLLQVDHATYMLPLDSLQRIVSVAPGDVQILEGRACLVFDGRPMALVHLTDLIGKTEKPGTKEERRGLNAKGHKALVEGRSSTGSGWSLALLLGSGERQVACMVDAVLGEQELVIYRLPPPLQRVRFIAGATILADGSVVPILDVVDLVRAAIGVHHNLNLAPEAPASEHVPTVLVVDDSITTRTLEKNILEAAGYQVKLATDGVEALDTLRHMVENGGCDLLLSDIDMPRLNGFELTSQVRQDTVLKNIPIVLVTSLDSSADRERGIAAGADAYIIKRAFDQQALLETIEQLI
jgi:two-component system chemotaxis sensor kinase CheA